MYICAHPLLGQILWEHFEKGPRIPICSTKTILKCVQKSFTTKISSCREIVPCIRLDIAMFNSLVGQQLALLLIQLSRVSYALENTGQFFISCIIFDFAVCRFIHTDRKIGYHSSRRWNVQNVVRGSIHVTLQEIQ